MQSLKVALLQLEAQGMDQEANCAKGLDFCRQAKAAGADIALFPEMWNIGYTPFAPAVGEDSSHPSDPKYTIAIAQWQQQAIDRQSPFFHVYQVLTRELHMAILLTYLEKMAGCAAQYSLVGRPAWRSGADLCQSAYLRFWF